MLLHVIAQLVGIVLENSVMSLLCQINVNYTLQY